MGLSFANGDMIGNLVFFVIMCDDAARMRRKRKAA